MGYDPLAGRDMRLGVAVAKHLGRVDGEREQKNRDRSETKAAKSGLCRVIGHGPDKWQS
jgi:hypothetical protein